MNDQAHAISAARKPSELRKAKRGTHCVQRVVRPLVKRKITVPIYDAELVLVVTDSIGKERRKMEHIFGPTPTDHNYDALTSYSGGHRFGLFFDRKAMTTKIIAHEVFHLTHRILDWVGANFDDKHHEQGALLCGYLMDWVCRETKWPNGQAQRPVPETGVERNETKGKSNEQ